MTTRLYLDEDSSDTDLLNALRLRGVNVVAAQECGMRGQSDLEQLRWATEHQRALYSANRRDFYGLHSEMMSRGETHAGIILGQQQRYSVGEQMRRLLRLIHTLSAEEMHNRIEFLSSW
jgi:post-segregation antitoxin (ccd killing protein)